MQRLKQSSILICWANRSASLGCCLGSIFQAPLNQSVWQAWHDAQPSDQRLDYETWAGEKIRRVVPLGRWQSTDDIADAVLFLSSPRAAQITGQTLNVDGGFVMR